MDPGRMSAPSVLFYVQHLLGIGHLARASRVAEALAADGFDVTMVTGGLPVSGFPGPRIRHVELPPVQAAEGFSGLVDAGGQPVDEAFRQRRAARLVALAGELRPDIVIVEAFPFGRRQVRFELLPLIDAVAAMSPKPLLVTSVRDILQERQKPGRDRETVETLNAAFDLVMAHGDPRFAALADTFPLAPDIRVPVGYTGLVAPPAPPPPAERLRVLVSAGGGAAGAGLVRAATVAARSMDEGDGWMVIAGPNLPQAEYDAAASAAPPGLRLVRFRPDFPALLGGADLSVSQAGYNTVCDILRAGCRSVLVPFAEGGETEQGVRASRLERLGLAHVLSEENFGPASLSAAIATARAAPAPPPAALDLDGAAGSARLLRAAMERRGAAATPDRSA
jgi:predicted glycosyltransferase